MLPKCLITASRFSVTSATYSTNIIYTCIYKYSINILEIPGTAAAVLFIYVYVCEQRAVLANDKNQHTDNQHSTLFYLCFFCFCFLYFFIGIRHSTGEHYYIWYPLRTHDENSTTTWLYSHLVPFIAFIYPLLSDPPPTPFLSLGLVSTTVQSQFQTSDPRSHPPPLCPFCHSRVHFICWLWRACKAACGWGKSRVQRSSVGSTCTHSHTRTHNRHTHTHVCSEVQMKNINI